VNVPHDTGAKLRSLYAPEGGVRSIFSAKVADYVASRPDYPRALFEALAARCPATGGTVVVAENSGGGDSAYCMSKLGISSAVQKFGAEVRNLQAEIGRASCRERV
jgi:hypothetical protein